MLTGCRSVDTFDPATPEVLGRRSSARGSAVRSSGRVSRALLLVLASRMSVVGSEFRAWITVAPSEVCRRPQGLWREAPGSLDGDSDSVRGEPDDWVASGGAQQ